MQKDQLAQALYSFGYVTKTIVVLLKGLYVLNKFSHQSCIAHVLKYYSTN